MKPCIRCGDESVPTSKQLCVKCKRESRSVRINQHRLRKLAHKKPSCEHCGFVALHPCQLDVDHVDGNRDNDDPRNYRTLCANCHRLKTHLNKDHAWTSKEPVPNPQLKLVV